MVPIIRFFISIILIADTECFSAENLKTLDKRQVKYYFLHFTDEKVEEHKDCVTQ